jgi:GWxTD domain-containing protein
MKKFAAVFFLLTSLLFAENKQPSQYDTWLQNEGYYLLSTQQKEKFRAITDTEKELYIRNVWASLDPDSITPENEFQIEYMKRFEYAKKNFKIPSDRAKVYLLLGAPNEVERHPNDDKFYPLELWSYYSLGVKGLPPSLDLIFFKRWGSGDYKLYSPLFDGLKALTPSQMDFQNPKVMAQVKAYFDPQIVEASRHLSTGAGQMESEEVRMRLQDPDLIQKSQKQRATVETTVVYEGFEADVYAYPVPSRDGTTRTSIAIAIPPKYVSFEQTGAQYQGRIDVIGRITDEKGNEILRINDSPAIKLSEADFQKARAYYFSYIFDAYLLPGKYNLDCLYRDYASNGAGKLEKSFEILSPRDELELLPPMIAIKSAPSKKEEMPFGYGWQQYYPKENATFGVGQTMTLYTRLLNPKRLPLSGTWHLLMMLSRAGENELETSEDIPVEPTTSDVEISRRIRLQSLVPGSYTLTLKLQQDQLSFESSAPLKIAQQEEQFGRIRISPPSEVPPEYYHTNLALQYYLAGNAEEAAKHVRIALDFAPSHYAARSLSARIEKLKGNTDAAIEAYEKLIQEQPADAEGTFLIGKWSLEKQDWRTASDMLKKAMAAGYYTTELLNGLAAAQLHLGNAVEAVDYWQKSLALDAHQPEIEKQLATHKQ